MDLVKLVLMLSDNSINRKQVITICQIQQSVLNSTVWLHTIKNGIGHALLQCITWLKCR